MGNNFICLGCEEDEEDCPADCGSLSRSIIYLVIVVIFIPMLVLIGYLLIKKSKDWKKKPKPQVHASLLRNTKYSKKYPDDVSKELKKIK